MTKANKDLVKALSGLHHNEPTKEDETRTTDKRYLIIDSVGAVHAFTQATIFRTCKDLEYARPTFIDNILQSYKGD